MELSVILCAYNPKPAYINRVIESLRTQTLPVSQWELIIVDNNSSNNFSKSIDLIWHPHHQIVNEPQAGLIYARIKGTKSASHPYIVTVDDDTVLDQDYLFNALEVFKSYPRVGIFGGRSKGEFEIPPPPWLPSFHTILCIKDLGNKPIIKYLKEGEKMSSYPSNGPFLIAYRKDGFINFFLPHFEKNSLSKRLGRKGSSLASGEDNDIVLTLYKNGCEIGYFPELWFTHLIPSERISISYLAKLLTSSSNTWVKVLSLHGICPWKKIHKFTLPFRKIKAFFTQKAWSNAEAYLRWCSVCGIFDGLSELD